MNQDLSLTLIPTSTSTTHFVTTESQRDALLTQYLDSLATELRIGGGE